MGNRCFRHDTSLSVPKLLKSGEKIYFTDSPPRTTSDGRHVGHVWIRQAGLLGGVEQNDPRIFQFTAVLTVDLTFAPASLSRGLNHPEDVLYRCGVLHTQIADITPLEPGKPIADAAIASIGTPPAPPAVQPAAEGEGQTASAP